jgi:circadian clock protein KaiA
MQFTNQYEVLSDKNLYVLQCYQQILKPLFPRMMTADQQALLQQLKSEYRNILIIYFTQDPTVPLKLDKFINALFCANIPVPQIIEIHMELIDEFSKQLKLEGRNDDTLLDYRLTLIDVLAHLCEEYRRSTPK